MDESKIVSTENKLELAKQTLLADFKAKKELFMEDYKQLTIKHGMELTTSIVWDISMLRVIQK
jgi:hypothetical protein